VPKKWLRSWFTSSGKLIVSIDGSPCFDLLQPVVEGSARIMSATAVLIMNGAECRPEFGTEEFPTLRTKLSYVAIVGANA